MMVETHNDIPDCKVRLHAPKRPSEQVSISICRDKAEDHVVAGRASGRPQRALASDHRHLRALVVVKAPAYFKRVQFDQVTLLSFGGFGVTGPHTAVLRTPMCFACPKH